MISKHLLVIFLFTIIPDQFVDSYEWLLNKEKVDDLMLRAIPFGHKTVKIPEKPADYAKICNDVSFTTMRPQIMALFGGSILKIEAYRKGALKVYKEKLKNRLCDLARSKDEKYTKFAKEINRVNSKMIPIRDGYTRAMIAASQNDTTLTGPDIVCFFKKWVSETLNCVTDKASKEILNAQVKGYMVVAENNKASATCDWDALPVLEQKPKFHSLELLFFEAGKNLAAIKSSKNSKSTTVAANLKPTTQSITEVPTEAPELPSA